ncbi:MAG: hypothetical protein ACUVSJ_10525, partial [Anaerolineae bacterium]
VVSLSIVLGIYLVLYNNCQFLLQFEWRIHWMPLVASFPSYSLALALAVLTWGLMLNKTGGRIGWVDHMRVYCITNLARHVPGALWYIIGRVATYERLGVSKSAVTVSSGLEAILIVLSGLIVALVMSPALVMTYLDSQFWWLAGCVATLAAIHPAFIRFTLRKLGTDTTIAGELRYRDLLVWLTLYSSVWVLGGLCLYELIAGVYPVSLSLFPVVIGAWAFSGTLSTLGMFLPVSSLLHTIALGALLALFLPLGVAVVATVLVRVVLTLYEVVWALIASHLLGLLSGIDALEKGGGSHSQCTSRKNRFCKRHSA